MSFWGTLGKIALKVAPIAAAFIPGVGIPLAMAIAGGTGVASKKIEGGSWKDSLLTGGIDAGLAGATGGLVKGLGPTASKLTKLGINEAGQLGKNAINSQSPSQPSTNQQPQTAGLNMAPSTPRGLAPSSNVGNTANNSVMPRGGYNFQNNPMNQLNQNSPNLAQSIFQGRQSAMKDQPFRAGYDVRWPGTILPGSPAGTETPYTTTRMPSIQSDINYNQQRRPRWNYGPPPPAPDQAGQ